MNTHTPAPWILGEPLPEENRIQIMKKDAPRPDDIAPTWVVANVNLCMGQESEANARLIAHAPDLFDACKMALEALRDAESYIPDQAMVRGKIARAMVKAGAKFDEKGEIA
jgi:hypothetical protein